MHFTNDEQIYRRLIIPRSALSHDLGNRARINAPGGFRHLLEVTPNQSQICLEDGLYVTRNISPHGLGGILLWDFSEKHYFRLTPDRQARFWLVTQQIQSYLMQEY